jgi:hypothetical protein
MPRLGGAAGLFSNTAERYGECWIDGSEHDHPT